ncbi:MAG TPA: MFS transporter [Chloroflexota bacterium]|nr:MFS transporter [Chloroflexota bacterium]
MDSKHIRLGLRANWRQFALLVLVNGFVGAMVGVERNVVPVLGRETFGLVSSAAVLSFIVSFGIVKAAANFWVGGVAGRFGRKRLLVAGWLVGIPAPLLVLLAPNWGWVVAANVLLGINQAFCWSMTVNMKIDLVGPQHRGLALGFNESAGYGAVGLAALASGYVAAGAGLRPWPFVLAIGFGLAGLLISSLLVRDTAAHLAAETAQDSAEPGIGLSPWQALRRGSWQDTRLAGCSQAGLVNNLNDGLVWGLVPLFLHARGVSVEHIALVTAVYPLTWGGLQLLTGGLSDRLGRRGLIVGGMLTQSAAIAGFLLFHDLTGWLGAALLLGLGTAMVYPTLMAAVSDIAGPASRASLLGVYRLWRDLGYAVGAVLSGVLADRFGYPAAIAAVATLTFISGAAAARLIQEKQRDLPIQTAMEEEYAYLSVT